MLKKASVTLPFLAVSALLWGMSQKVHPPSETFQATSIDRYEKPGAGVDITFRSVRLAPGEEGSVFIELLSSKSASLETMRVKFGHSKALRIVDMQTSRSKQGTYVAQMQVSSDTIGKHYIRVFVEMKKGAKRVFSVPVFIEKNQDEKTKDTAQKSTKASKSLLKAQERIMSAN